MKITKLHVLIIMVLTGSVAAALWLRANKEQEERMGSDFSFSRLLLDKAERGEKFTR